MDKMTEEIVGLCDDIFQNLGLEYVVDDLNLLFNEQIYFEMYKIMFPFLDDAIQHISMAHGRTGGKLQELIDLLSSSVLTMDLSHIKGDQIAKGDTKHLYYFLQLLFELSRLFKTQNQQEPNSQDPNIKSTPISRNLSEQDGDYQRNHSVMGINQEFGDDRDYQQYDQNFSPNMYMQDASIKKKKKTSKKSEVSKESNKKKKLTESQSDQQKGSSSRRGNQDNDYYDQNAQGVFPDDLDPEQAQQYIQQMQEQGQMFSDEDQQQQYESSHSRSQASKQSAKQIHRSKSTRDLGDKKKSDLPANNKHNQMKALEENILSITQKQHRIITTNPNIGTKKQQKHPPAPVPVEEYDVSDIDLQFLEQVDPDEIAKLPENHPVLIKYQRELEKLQYFEELQQQQQKEPDQNIEDVIEAQIYNVKESLKGMRESKEPLDEKKTVEQIIRKRNEYKSFLKDYLNQYNQKQKDLGQHKERTQVNQQKKMMKIRHEEGDLKKQYEQEHLSTYYKMRDEKLIYLRKIHRIIFELEKRKIIDEKKDHLQLRRQQNVATRNALTSIENAYNNRIVMLKDKLREERQERHVSSVAQRQILSKLERELKGEKLKQIEDLKDVQRQEKERFDFLIKDDGQLEQKILQIYKKY